jgi:hypothetical protein
LILVKDANGICVLKKFIENNKSDIIKNEIYREAKKEIYSIIKNPFGNYILQMLVDVNNFFNFENNRNCRRIYLKICSTLLEIIY